MGGPNERTELIGLIYEAALDRRVWPAVADRLADLMGAVTCRISSYDCGARTAVGVAPRVPPEALRCYAEHWVHHNPLVAVGRRMPVGEVFRDRDLVTKQDFARTPVYNEFFAPLDMHEGIGAGLLVEGPIWAYLGIWRPARMDAFDPSDRTLLGGLIPHLQRAMQLGLRLTELEVTRTASAELLDRLRQATLLVDASCRVMFANRPAEEILANRLGLQCGAGRVLRTDRHADTAALHRLVAKAAEDVVDGQGSAGGRLRLLRGELRAPLSVLVIPLRAEAQWPVPHHPAAILFVTDPERASDPTAASLRRSFGLTRTEAAVALEVLNGGGLKVAASRLGINPTTARTHLTAVFDKTDTRRQADLVRALLQNGGMFREE
jgi:DNA-binding CsgD family transcriptional regulator